MSRPTGTTVDPMLEINQLLEDSAFRGQVRLDGRTMPEVMEVRPLLGYFGKNKKQRDKNLARLIVLCEKCCERHNPYLIDKTLPKCPFWAGCVESFDSRAKDKHD